MKDIDAKVWIEVIEVDHGIYHALLSRPCYGIKGCPMGRGKTEEKAIKDLIYRINIESGFIVNPIVSMRISNII